MVFVFILPVIAGLHIYYDYKGHLKKLGCDNNRILREQNSINREIFEYEKYNSDTYVKELRRIENDERRNLSKLEGIYNKRPRGIDNKLSSPIDIVNPFSHMVSDTELAKKKVLMYYDYLEKNDLKNLECPK